MAPMRAVTRITLIAFVSFGICSCAVNNQGLLAGRVTQGKGAEVVEIYTLGARLHTWAWDAGLILGLSRVLLIYPARQAGAVEEGWRIFHIPMPNSPPLAFRHSTLGAELTFTGHQLGITVGHRDIFVLAMVAKNEKAVMELTYTEGRPADTHLELRKREAP